MFFLWATRSNWRNLDTAGVSLNMSCFLVCLYCLEYLHGVSDIPIPADFVVSVTLPLSRKTLTSICLFVYTLMTRSIALAHEYKYRYSFKWLPNFCTPDCNINYVHTYIMVMRMRTKTTLTITTTDNKNMKKKNILSKKNCKINLFCDSFGIGATISIPGEVQWSPVCRILFYIIRNCFCSFGLLTAFYLYRKVHVCLENIY